MEHFRKLQKDPPQSFSPDLNCELIPTIDLSRYYTREGFLREIVRKLDMNGGRQGLDDIFEEVQVNSKYFKGGSPLPKMLPASVQLIRSELISDSYWRQLKSSIQRKVQEQGRLRVLDLASEHALPMDSILARCISEMDNTSLIGDSKILVSNIYLAELHTTALQRFKDLTAPTSVSTICQDHGWDFDLVLGWLLSEGSNIGGEIHVDPTSSAAAMFLPNVYTQNQNKEILDFVSVNGYMTADRARRQGMAMAQMVSLVKESFADVIVIGNILILEHVLQSVQVAIQECDTTGSVDLQEYIPAEIIQFGIAKDLLQLAGFTSDIGVSVLADDQAVIVSSELVKEIQQKVLVPLIQTFAKQQAEVIFNATPDLEEEEEGEETLATNRKKGRSRSRKGKNAKEVKSSKQTSAIGYIPLLQVTGAVLKEYPNFMGEFVEQDLLDQAEDIAWEDEDSSGLLLVEFCKAALYTLDYRTKYDKAVRAELKRLQSKKESKATISRKDAAAKVRSVEAAFEENFVTVCYTIQALSKFIGLASTSEYFDKASIEILRAEFLQGCCADLTSRLTQYCIFKNEEDVIFTFRHPGEDIDTEVEVEKILPGCCAHFDPASRQFRQSYLSCAPPREPLPVLRESLPGNLGVTLAKLWVFCGGECYRGGVRQSEEDGSTYTRPGSIDSFLSHVEDNCL